MARSLGWTGATGRFDGFITAFWNNLNNEGGTPVPTVLVDSRESLEIAGGFKFSKAIHEGEGSISIKIDYAEDLARIIVKIVATGSFPSFEFQGTGTYEDDDDRDRAIECRYFTLQTANGPAKVRQSSFRATPRWYPGLEFVIEPEGQSTVSVIFEKIKDGSGLVAAEPVRDEDPRPSPFEDEP